MHYELWTLPNGSSQVEDQFPSSQGKQDVQINKKTPSPVKERKRFQQRVIMNKIALDSSGYQPVDHDPCQESNNPLIGVI